jgi:hypothetical protein
MPLNTRPIPPMSKSCYPTRPTRHAITDRLHGSVPWSATHLEKHHCYVLALIDSKSPQ